MGKFNHRKFCVLKIKIMSILSIDVGIKNLSFALLNKSTIENWGILNVEVPKHQDLCESIVKTLDKYPDLLQAHTVVIEKQPSKNNKMRIVEALLNSYFVIKGKCNENSAISKVVVYSAKHKLNNHVKFESAFKGKTGYTNRKRLSVNMTSKFLELNPQCEEIKRTFDTSKKKDDLADALLMGLRYQNIEVLCEDKVENSINEVVSLCKFKVISREPTPNQKKKKNGYSRSNLKWFVNQWIKDEECISRDIIIEKMNIDKKIVESCKKWYTSIEEAVDCLYSS